MKSNNDRDTTIAEIHRTRETISGRFDGDLQAIVEDARKRQQDSKVPTVSFSKPEPAKAEN